MLLKLHCFYAVNIFVILIWLPVPVSAHDYFQPDWRGDNYTTFQEWQFSTANNPAVPESINNPFGTARAAIDTGPFSEEWFDTQPVLFKSSQGLWDLGSEGTMVIDIDNRPDGGEYKEIWVQISYVDGFTPYMPPVVSVPGAVPYGDPVPRVMLEDLGLGDALWVEVTKWRIFPNPNHEQIVITADPWGSIVDQVVVDTICVPGSSIVPVITIIGYQNGVCHLSWSPAGSYILQFDTTPTFTSPVSIPVDSLQQEYFYDAGSATGKGYFRLVEP